MRGFLGSHRRDPTPASRNRVLALVLRIYPREPARFKSEGMLRSKCFSCEAGLSGHSSTTMRDGLPGIASEEAESKALLLDNAHLLSRTDLGDLALARGLRLRLLF